MHIYDRNNPIYPQDRIVPLKATHRLAGNIEERGTVNHRSLRLIDGAIQVESVDHKTRQHALAYFGDLQHGASSESLHQNRRKWIGISAATLGTAAAIATAFAPHVAAAAVLACAVAPSVIGGVAVAVQAGQRESAAQHDAKSAEKMSHSWEDPASRIIHDRISAGKQGFSYAFSHNLKGTSLHPEEVRELWMDAARIQNKAIIDGSFSVESVFADDLLGTAKMRYGVGPLHDIPGEKGNLIEAAANRYRSLRSDYQAFRSAIDSQSTHLKRIVDQQLAEIASEELHWLRPITHTRDAALLQASTYRNHLLEPYQRERDYAIAEAQREPLTSYEKTLAITAIHSRYNRDPAVVAIEREYRRDQAMINTIYAEARNSLSAHFTSRVNQVRALAANCQNVIDSQRKVGIAQFAEPLRQIATARNQRELRAVQSPTLHTEQRWMMPQRTPAQWNDFHSQFRYRSTLADVTQGAWDLFFGREGVSSYYGMNDSRWSDYTPRFHFRNNFHMHGTRYAPPAHGCYRDIGPHAQPGTRPAQPAAGPTPHRSPVHTPPEPVRPQPAPHRPPVATPVPPVRPEPVVHRPPVAPVRAEPVPVSTESHVRVGFGGTRRR